MDKQIDIEQTTNSKQDSCNIISTVHHHRIIIIGFLINVQV